MSGDPLAGLEGVTLLAQATRSAQTSARGDRVHVQKMATLGELAGGITHDFQNILQIVMSNLDIIKSRANDPAEVRRLTASALRAAERGISLTKRLLTFAHYEAVDARPTCLLSSLESATETLTRTVEATMNVWVELPSSDLWQVMIDPSEFELALINLGINARDAMPSGGRIRLGARNVTIPLVDRRTLPRLERHEPTNRRGPRLALPGGDYVAVTVEDTGTGMDEATLARAIEPFFTTKPLGNGTGLGLSMVHDLATQARGALRLISQPGRGTTAELWLPRAWAPVATKPPITFPSGAPNACEEDDLSLSGNVPPPSIMCSPDDQR
jgi:signal transduction histidine kinase